MNERIALKWQLGLCGALSLALAMDWGLGQWSRHNLEKAMKADLESDYQAIVLPELPRLTSTVEDFAEIVDKPLFVEGRKPIVETETNPSEQAADMGQLEDWQLMGVYSKHQQPAALFVKASEGKRYTKLTLNQSISGWILKEIETDQVTLERAGQQKKLLLHKAKPKLPKKPPTPTTAARSPAAIPTPVAQPPIPQPENNSNESE